MDPSNAIDGMAAVFLLEDRRRLEKLERMAEQFVGDPTDGGDTLSLTFSWSEQVGLRAAIDAWEETDE